VLIPIQSSIFLRWKEPDDLLENDREKLKRGPNPKLELLGVLSLLDKRTTFGSKEVSEQFAGRSLGAKMFDTVIYKSVRLGRIACLARESDF